MSAPDAGGAADAGSTVDRRPAGGRVPSDPSAMVAIAIVVLLVVATAGVAIAHHRDRRGQATGDDQRTATSSADGAAAPVAGTDPGLTGPGVLTDAFTHGPGLGTGPGGRPWRVARGSWAVAAGIVSVSGGLGGGLNLATLDIGTPDVRAQVTLPTGAPGAALAFRVVDPQNYWTVASAPAGGPVTIVQVVAGRAVPRGHAGVVPAGPGTTIGVDASGPTIRVYVNGIAVATARDPHPGGDAIGLGTSALETAALFADLLYLPHG